MLCGLRYTRCLSLFHSFFYFAGRSREEKNNKYSIWEVGLECTPVGGIYIDLSVVRWLFCPSKKYICHILYCIFLVLVGLSLWYVFWYKIRDMAQLSLTNCFEFFSSSVYH